jgi:hypothetical protein
MSVSTEVQRTLVKSPPELWSELSNPDALARHLSELGEIRITSVEPETKVEWESEGISGIVQLKQSGWGTKVTLSVTRTAAIVEGPPSGAEPVPAEPGPRPEPVTVEPEPTALQPEPVTVEPEPAALEPEPVTVEHEPAALEPEPVTVEHEPAALEPEPVTVEHEPAALESKPAAVESEPAAPVEPDPEYSAAEPEPQLGFFARLFRKRKAKPVAVIEPEPEIEVEVVALAAPEPVYPERPIEVEPEVLEPADDLAAELGSMEAQMAQETTELLTDMLDRLGAAHHRPFSRG